MTTKRKRIENLTTPFKAMVSAVVANFLVQQLGLGDVEADAAAASAWVVITGALTLLVPSDFGSSISAKLLAFFLRIKNGAAAMALVMGVASAGMIGCGASQPVDPNAPPPPPLTEAQIQERNEKRCIRAEFLVSAGKATARLLLKDEGPKTKARVRLGIEVVDQAMGEYCNQVMLGEGNIELEYIAMKALLKALDDLAELSIEPEPEEEPAPTPE